MSVPVSLIGNAWAVIAGVETHHRYEREQMASCRQVANGFDSDDVCAFQARVHAGGRRVARLVRAASGWSVRASSGLDGFAVLASPGSGQVDGTFESALAWVADWVAESPRHRSAIAFASDIPGPHLSS